MNRNTNDKMNERKEHGFKFTIMFRRKILYIQQIYLISLYLCMI